MGKILDIFLNALAVKDVDVMKDILSKCKAEANIQQYVTENCPFSPLHTISTFDLNDVPSREIFFLLCKHPCINLKLKTAKGETILHLAHSKQLVSYTLIYAKVDINARNKSGETALMYRLNILPFIQYKTQAVSVIEICEWLIENGANIKIADDIGNSAIHMVAYFDLRLKQMDDLFKCLVNHENINLNVQNCDGKTVLHLTQSVRVVKKLLSTGKLNVNVKDNEGNTALICHLSELLKVGTEREETVEICKLLMQNGTEPISLEKFMLLNVHSLFALELKDSFMKVLFMYVFQHLKGSINFIDLKHNTILHLTKSKVIVGCILANIRTVDVNAKNLAGETPIMVHLWHVACANPDSERVSLLSEITICEQLIEFGADVNQFSVEKQLCPLHLLANLNLKVATVRNFFDYVISHPRTNINAQDGNGNTLLHLAKSPIMVSMLLWNSKIQIDIQNKKGETAFYKHFYDQMHSRNHLYIANSLLNAGADLKNSVDQGKNLLQYLCEMSLPERKTQQIFCNILQHLGEIINSIAPALLYHMSRWAIPITKILELPFELPYLMLLFKDGEQKTVQMVYAKWDEADFSELIHKLLDYITKPKGCQFYSSSTVMCCWKYLQLHKRQIKDENYKTFFSNLIFPTFLDYETNRNDFEEFFKIFLRYNNKPRLSLLNLKNVYQSYGDCDELKDIVLRIDSHEFEFLSLKFDPFLYSITKHYGTADDLCAKIILHTEICRFDTTWIQNIANYYTPTDELFKFAFRLLPSQKDALKKIKRTIEKLKSLLEISRDCARVKLKNMYDVRCPSDLKCALDQLAIPPGIQDILLMRTHLYPRAAILVKDIDPECYQCDCPFCLDCDELFEFWYNFDYTKNFNINSDIDKMVLYCLGKQ